MKLLALELCVADQEVDVHVLAAGVWGHHGRGWRTGQQGAQPGWNWWPDVSCPWFMMVLHLIASHLLVLQIHHANAHTCTHSHTHGEWGQLSGASDPSRKHSHTCTHSHTHGEWGQLSGASDPSRKHTHTPTHVGSGDSSVVLQIHHAHSHTHGEWGQLSGASDPSCKHTHTRTHMWSGDSSVVLQIHHANTHTHIIYGEQGQLSD